MDKKTCEYMKKRTKAYTELEHDIQELKECKADVLKWNGFEIGTNNCRRSFYGKSETKLIEAVSKAIDERLIEAKTEMEEI